MKIREPNDGYATILLKRWHLKLLSCHAIINSPALHKCTDEFLFFMSTIIPSLYIYMLSSFANNSFANITLLYRLIHVYSHSFAESCYVVTGRWWRHFIIWIREERPVRKTLAAGRDRSSSRRRRRRRMDGRCSKDDEIRWLRGA